ncbi:MAG: TonB-dependent receptor [Gammaproteobacteria bacterium]|nr:TonB-dependent receptor [Gammaproteobacteria bacterium]MBQ0840656.1 TonB-dependent receptor [Gammaproteobacteria bacterium]
MKTASFTGLLATAVSLLGLYSNAVIAADYSDDTLQEVVVTATFRELDILTVPASLTVIDQQLIAERGAVHIESILNAAPNVNFASGASRGRYLQIRGIGERSQFVDPVNPSVGLLIDDIDVSGMGNAATLFDVRQVEILRGPQGTRFGASALAGMVNIRSNDPTEDFEALVNAGYGNYDSWNTGAVVSGPLAEGLLGRLAVQQQRSDGFIDNDYLGRDNTNNIDELSTRGKLRWLASDDLSIDLSGFYVDIDNGYDAFSLDNTRHTLSDEPGHDRQETTAFALSSTWAGHRAFTLQTIATWSDSNLEYGYDEDWSYAGLCTATPCDGWEYSSTDNYIREREASRLELRFTSTEEGQLAGNTDWVAGVYYDQRDEDLTRQFFDWDLYSAAEFDSRYETENLALYGQLSMPLTNRLTLTVGGRWERFEADYQDSRAVKAAPDEDLWGGQLSLEYSLDQNTMVYGLLSRGYKAGGVNGDALGRAQSNGFAAPVIDFLNQRLEFDTETLLNYELGLKGSYLDDSVQLRVAAFYMDRDDIQLKGWYNEGPLFVGYIDNAASGENLGLEFEALWQLSARLELFANLAWLDTEIDNFIVKGDTGLVDKSGREQAHAPNYQFNVGGRYRFGDGFYARLEAEGKDAFYFSDSHDQQSDSYELINASFGYQNLHWDITLWARNLSDEDYAVRGFYFGNDPRKFYDDEEYVQYGEPRVFGANATYRF